MTTETMPAAEALYRFFAGFAGFDDTHTIGFEAEIPPPRRQDGQRTPGAVLSAVFSMEPVLTQVRRYIHGGGSVRGACTVSARVRDADTAHRLDAAAFFAALSDYVRTHGAHHTDGARVFVIRPAAHPARVLLTDDGAVWELRCTVEITE